VIASAWPRNEKNLSGAIASNLTPRTRHVTLIFMTEPAKTPLAPHDVPQDQDLLAAADLLFVELDNRERSE
jgi:hypothetical protein